MAHSAVEPISARRHLCIVAGVVLAVMGVPAVSYGWDNVLQDPGFERYHYDADLGYYVPDANAAWTEFGFGRASVRFDGSSWTAPPEMAAERELGFTPGAMGFEGYGATENTGVMILDQNFLNPAYLRSGSLFEAWVWVGGAGLDNETGADFKDEHGGWEIFFYSDPNPANWTTSNALEYHKETFDFYGEANSFVRVSGFGKIPASAVGFKMRIVSGTWYPPAGGGNYDTQVAIDNAHFAVIKSENLLVNGNFEQDVTPADFTGWQRPAAWSFPKNGQRPMDMRNVYGDNIDHGTFRPYWGGSRAYGYETWLYDAWIDDAFSFSQVVDHDAPPGTPLTFMFYWLQDTRDNSYRWQLRTTGGEIGAVLQYLDENMQEIDNEAFLVNWPVPSNPENGCKYDFNAAKAYNPRFQVAAPAGTKKIRVNINVMTHLLYSPELQHVAYLVDEFYLGYAEEPDSITYGMADSIEHRSAVVHWTTNRPLGSAVDYGTTTAYGQTVTDATDVTTHAVPLTGLIPGRKYYVRLRSGTATYPKPADAADVFFVTRSIGDIDGDGDVDQEDFGLFQACMSEPGTAPDSDRCGKAFLDADEDVDSDDFGIFQACMSGADVPFDPACAD